MKTVLVSRRVNEVVSSRANELRHRCGEVQADQNGRLLRKQRADKGLKRGPYVMEVKPTKPRVKVEKPKGKPGRPPVYNDLDRKIMEEALRQYGLTRAQRVLKERGGRCTNVSVITLQAVAKKKGITFRMGRPVAA